MDQHKMSIIANGSWIKKITNQNKSLMATIQLTTTIIFSLSIAFFIVVLGMFINNNVTKFLVSKEHYYPTMQNMDPSIVMTLNQSFFEFVDLLGPKELLHSISDEERMWRASMMPHVKSYPIKRIPKVAFMFLTRGKLPLAPLWELFFKGHEGFYSIYIHNSSEFVSEPPQSSVFYKRTIPSKPAEWGKATIVDAERRLLANALLDFFNERFILLSESCIPLFNFTTIYIYLINSKHSYIGSFDDPRKIGRGRYNKQMAPTILLSDWRKGSQWFEVQRELALAIVSDSTFYPILRDHCTPPCYMDEHYLATLMSKFGKGLNSNRSITWVDWSKPGSHPTTFVRKDVSKWFLEKIRNQYGCIYNNVLGSICFLFARKFHPNTLEPLLMLAPVVLGFNP